MLFEERNIVCKETYKNFISFRHQLRESRKQIHQAESDRWEKMLKEKDSKLYEMKMKQLAIVRMRIKEKIMKRKRKKSKVNMTVVNDKRLIKEIELMEIVQ